MTEPLLIDMAELGRLMTRSRPSLERDLAAGRLPRPLKVGRSNRWRLAEIRDWIDAGAPTCQKWEAMRAAADKP